MSAYASGMYTDARSVSSSDAGLFLVMVSGCRGL